MCSELARSAPMVVRSFLFEEGLKKMAKICFLMAYIFTLVGMSICSAGKAFPAGVYPWYLPFELLALLSIPAILGYLIGKDDSIKI